MNDSTYQRVGFTCGVMDLLHVGHIRMLQDAKSKCDYLIVALQTDPTVDRPYKNKPIQTVDERVEQLQALRSVDAVIKYTTEEELLEILKTLKYDVRIIGSDWKGKQYTGIDIPGHSEKVYFHDRSGHNFSSTELRQRIMSNQLANKNTEN